MSTTETEFQPIESKPARKAWPFALLGAGVAALAAWIIHLNTGPAPREMRAAALADLPAAAKAADPKVAEAKATETPAKAEESPNVLGAAVAATGKLAMVARAELERELGHTRAAQREAAAYKKQIATLTRELSEARAQIAAMQKAQQPPPPSDREQILQMLAPVLKASNEGAN